MTSSKLPTKAMLLAAGEGTRLRPLTNHVPKSMVPLAGKPVLEHNIEWLRSFGVAEFMINLHYMPDAVRDYFGDGRQWGVSIKYSVEEELLGTAGGVKKAEQFFDGPFFVWYGDNLSNIDLQKFSEFHEQNAAMASVALFYRADPTASGIVGLDKNKRITRFLEKPTADQVFSHWVSAGIYLLEQPVLNYIPPSAVSDFGHDVLPAMLSEDVPMYGYEMGEEEKLWWIDTPVDLQRIQELFERRLSTT
jgi:mannose-1-phosphate guanylyltransferase/phosphomannomutase